MRQRQKGDWIERALLAGIVILLGAHRAEVPAGLILRGISRCPGPYAHAHARINNGPTGRKPSCLLRVGSGHSCRDLLTLPPLAGLFAANSHIKHLL
jgi:hypothetical protein